MDRETQRMRANRSSLSDAIPYADVNLLFEEQK
jgi:hypothetical protein